MVNLFSLEQTQALFISHCSLHVMCAGRVLNRFSKDLGFLDDIIPQPFFDYLAVRPVVICVLHPMLHAAPHQ